MFPRRAEIPPTPLQRDVRTLRARDIEGRERPRFGAVGQASPGGIVNVVSKRPTDSPLRELQRAAARITTGSSWRLQRTHRRRGRLTCRPDQPGAQCRHDDRPCPGRPLLSRPRADLAHQPGHLADAAGELHEEQDHQQRRLPARSTVKYNPNGRIPRHRFTASPTGASGTRRSPTWGYQFAHRFNDTWQFKQNLGYAQSRNRVNHAYWWTWVPGSDFSTAERGAYRRDDDAHGVSIDNQFEGHVAIRPLQAQHAVRPRLHRSLVHPQTVRRLQQPRPDRLLRSGVRLGRTAAGEAGHHTPTRSAASSACTCRTR